MKKLAIFILATLYLSSSVAGPVRLNIFKKRPKTQNVVTLYDTVRVVVTDTIRVEPKPAPRIDTLRHTLTPTQIDSLLHIWQTMSITESHDSYFEQFSADLTEECNLPKDSLYKMRLQDMVSPVHLPYNSAVRKYIDYYLENKWSPMSRMIGLSKFYFPIFEQELINAGLPVE